MTTAGRVASTRSGGHIARSPPCPCRWPFIQTTPGASPRPESVLCRWGSRAPVPGPGGGLSLQQPGPWSKACISSAILCPSNSSCSSRFHYRRRFEGLQGPAGCWAHGRAFPPPLSRQLRPQSRASCHQNAKPPPRSHSHDKATWTGPTVPLLVSHPHWPGSGEEQGSPRGWAAGCSPLHSGAPLAGRTRAWDSRVTLRAGVARVLCRDCVWPSPVDTDVAPALQAACGPGLTVRLLLPHFHTCGTASERKPGAPGASRPDPPSLTLRLL